LGVGFDVGLQFENDWQFGLMVRDITTTYNVWNIDERNIKNCRCRTGQNQELPESTEVTAPKAQWDFLKVHYP
jgi:hypothetical protein